MAFVPLFCQSNYSTLGVNSPAELVQRARAVGYGSIGICDESTMVGHHEFDEACRAQGVRPIFGCRIVIDGFVTENKKFPLDFLIESEQGYRNLVRILSQYHELKDRESGLARKLGLKGRTQGLWVVLPPEGELYDLVKKQSKDGVERFIQMAVEYFSPNLALGVTPATRASSETDTFIRRLAGFAHITCVAAPQILFAEPGDAPAFEFLKNPISAPERGWKPPEDPKTLSAIFSEADILARFAEEDESVHESGEIARRCAWRPGINRRLMPVQDFERGFDANSFLFDLVIRGAADRYGEIREDVKQRINGEFEEVKQKNLSPYLLLHREITNHLDKEGISRGVGRGAIVASVFAYCLGITRLDPLQYRLAFQSLAGDNETFPPIWIEIPSSAMTSVIAWLKDKYGENHLVQIGRKLELRREQMIQELAAWAGMTEDEKRQTVREKLRRKSTNPAQILQEQAEGNHWKRWRNPSFLSEIAQNLSPRPKGILPNPSLWTISSEPLEHVIPTRRSAEGMRFTDIGESAIDRFGGARLEFVSHHLLNLLERARAGAGDLAPRVDFHTIPLDDRATFELIGRGETLGIPPLESITVKCLLRKNRPTTILQLLKIKTDASKGAEKHVGLTDALSDVLSSYQLAFFKTHYREAFFAAALSSAAELGENVSAIVKAVRRLGIEILPPDINLSGPISSVFSRKIRLGLMMIRGMKDKSLDEILSVRLGGRFNSLSDFCARVSHRVVNLKLLQNLIGSGAFDCFGKSRGQMAAVVAGVYRKHKNLDNSPQEDEPVQSTLFDLNSIEEEFSNASESTGSESDWDSHVSGRREIEALGFSLSDAGLARYAKILGIIRPLSPESIGPRLSGRSVTLAGLIDHADFEGPLSGPEGGCLVDLEGVAVRLNPNLARLCRHALHNSEAVLAIGKVNPREGYICVEADGLWRLEDLEQQATAVAAVRLNLDGENGATVRHLLSLSRHFRGETKLEIVDYPRGKGLSYRLLARQRIFFCSPFYQGLCKILPMDRVELFGSDGGPLAIALARAEGDLED